MHFRSIKAVVVAAFIAQLISLAPNTFAQSPVELAASAAKSASLAESSAQAASKSAAAAASAASSTNTTWSAPNDLILYGVPVIVLLGSLMAILAIQRALKTSTFSLADALSEEVNLPSWKENKDTAGTITREPKLDKDDKPILAPEMRASTSRVIALMGMVVLLFMYIGFGVFALYGFGKTGRLPKEIDGVVSFLAAGMTLFAPYVVNKFSSLFQGLTGGK